MSHTPSRVIPAPNAFGGNPEKALDSCWSLPRGFLLEFTPWTPAFPDLSGSRFGGTTGVTHGAGMTVYGISAGHFVTGS
jgi:hypothetical protein